MPDAGRVLGPGEGAPSLAAPMLGGPEPWECNDPVFGFREERDLVPGELDDDAVDVFTLGHCHSFAEALRRLLIEAELVFAYVIRAGEIQGHVLLRAEGRYLDARGWIEELDQFLDDPDPNRSFEREWAGVEVIAPGGWRAISDDWLEPRVEDAIPFARTLLARLGVPEERERRDI